VSGEKLCFASGVDPEGNPWCRLGRDHDGECDHGASDVCVLWLCEAVDMVKLRPDMLYRFEVKAGCARCEELAAPYQSRVPSTSKGEGA
jgi:hypothetical protein